MGVESLEWIEGALLARGRHETFADAAAALPAGAYTTFRTYSGRGVLRLGQHTRRLEESAALRDGSPVRGRPGELRLEDIRAAVGAALSATRHPESRVRVTFAPPRLFVGIGAFVPPPAALYEEGASCMTVPVRRENPHAKDTRFIATAAAAYAALPTGIEEGLMVAEDGVVLEGLSSNFFAVRGGRLWTEEGRALLGVTRSLVIEVAATVLPVERTGIALEPPVDECFITSVSREVMPVVRVDGRPVGEGRPGTATRAIARGFRELALREAEVV